ncbi:DEAD/DEAH box helicase, partial [Acinetobacter junii]|uniref:DEAD/DEAH box helicase n=1 Tax=Acinetobacter junii TaxID=40215 RepID=UPI00125F6002
RKPRAEKTADAPRADKPKTDKPRSEKPRRERAPKPVDTWKLEDFVVEPMEGKTRFHDFKLAPSLMHAIHDLGFPYCTPIQAGVLGFTLKGQDAIGRAQTGTGKTAGCALPLLQKLTQEGPQVAANSGRALVLVPTRELAEQVHQSLQAYGQHLPLRTYAVYGGVSINPQMMKLRKGIDLLVATPGRLLD